MARRQRREALDAVLSGIEGVQEVYFQPPATVKMVYPCIVYRRDDLEVEYADNLPYRSTDRYQVTVIDPDPDSEIPDRVSNLPLCSFDRAFAADNMNHDVYNLFF